MITKKIGVVSLGCDKNRVDTEYMLAALQAAGHTLVQRPEEAEILIVNTCAFLESARAEAISTVLELSELKQTAKLQKLIVTGCLPQGYSEELKELTEADAVMGVNAWQSVAEVIARLYVEEEQVALVPPAEQWQFTDARVITTPPHYAYLKIADGCNNFCSYCLIPYLRGRYRSKPIALLVEEATALVEGGARELILVAQDVTRYGYDWDKQLHLTELLQALKKIEGLEWIRLLYCYPELVTDGLIEEMATNPKVVPYIDIPLQHISDGILRRMNRRSTKAQTEEIIRKLREKMPDIAIRTTFIVGFPGETEEDFSEILEFLKAHELEHAGFFAYSQEEGTRAATFPDQVDEAVKQRRKEQAEALQAEIMLKKAEAMIGKTVTVVTDGIDFELGCFYGRTEAYAPDIDNAVYFTSDGDIAQGEIYQVTVTDTLGLCLRGTVTEGEEE